MTEDPTKQAQDEHVQACINAARTALHDVASAPRDVQITALQAADSYLLDALHGKPKLKLSERLTLSQTSCGINPYREAVEDARVALPLFDDLVTLEQAREVFANLRRILGMSL